MSCQAHPESGGLSPRGRQRSSLSPGKTQGEFLLTPGTERGSTLRKSPGPPHLARGPAEMLPGEGQGEMGWAGSSQGPGPSLSLLWALSGPGPSISLLWALSTSRGLSSSRNFHEGILPNTHQPDLFYSRLLHLTKPSKVLTILP